VSVNQAEALLEKFGSIPNILKKKTTQKELMDIDGINRRKAKAILSLRD
jgi:ERCC4-type nuclease